MVTNVTMGKKPSSRSLSPRRLAKHAKFRKVATDLPGPKGRLNRQKRRALKGVQVTTAARLHLGFLDPGGDLGRRFGSIGLAIDAFETRVELRESPSFEVLGEERERGAKIALRIIESLSLDTRKKLIISNAIPAHAGLGSGTQLALAIASAFRRLAGLPPDAREDARLLDRGGRSGVGVSLFERGGLAVDAGRGPNTEVPPVVAWMNFPRDWRILLILDPRARGRSWRRGKASLCRVAAFSSRSGERDLSPRAPADSARRGRKGYRGFRRRRRQDPGNPRRSFRSGPRRRPFRERAGEPSRHAIEGSRGARHWPKLLGTDRFCLCFRPRPCAIPCSARAGRARNRGADQNLQRARSRRRDPRRRRRFSPIIVREEQWPRTSCT